jgi:hypothetical protein
MRLCLSLLILPLAGGLACEPTYNYVGYKMHKQFPLDGDRNWTYQSDDETVTYEMLVEKEDPPSTSDGYEVYTFAYYNDTDGTLLHEVDWSSDSINGVAIHGYRDYEGSGGDDTGGLEANDSQVFDPPIIFADDDMAPGASVTTTTGGWTFTSTLEVSEPCPNPWVEDWNDCLKMVLEDDGSGSLVSGNYWLVPRYGVAWMRRTVDADTWKLRDADWTAD